MEQILVIDGWGICCEIALIWMSLDFTDEKSTLVQVMAWCHQATSHYLSQCGPRSPDGVTRPQWVNDDPLDWCVYVSPGLNELRMTELMEYCVTWISTLSLLNPVKIFQLHQLTKNKNRGKSHPSQGFIIMTKVTGQSERHKRTACWPNVINHIWFLYGKG